MGLAVPLLSALDLDSGVNAVPKLAIKLAAKVGAATRAVSHTSLEIHGSNPQSETE